jgi:hypothetical protein
MLRRVQLPRRFLDGITDGSIDLAFRRWRRPTVRAGGRLRTPIGELAITAVDIVRRSDIDGEAARRAGHTSLAELLSFLDSRDEGEIYRVALRLAGPDTRIALRERAELAGAELADLEKRLARLDAASKRGPWTLAVLRLIAARPAERAPNLAASLGLETLVFKTDVRKLKNLGLTESLAVGYRLSPRGQALLALRG